MAEPIHVTAEKIRKLQVQGARNVAIAAVKAIQTQAQQTNAKNKTQFLCELKEAQTILVASRETEPLMRNAIRYLITQAQNATTEKIEALSQTVVASANQFLKDLEATKEVTAQIGAKRIVDGSVVFTHCHSSTVTRLLSKAKEDGKNFKVICTETRPAFQGRITAKELVDLGIETTFIVDSAARSFMGKVDLVIVGADAITSEGNVVNKIGSSAIAVLASEARVPFYVVSELLKFDPETLRGEREKIEQRSPAEVWSDAPPKLIVRNPAFDVTPNRYIHGIICEEGIIPPQTIVEVMRRKYPWVFDRIETPQESQKIEDLIERIKPQKVIEKSFRLFVQKIERLSSEISKEITETRVKYKTKKDFVGVQPFKTEIKLHFYLRRNSENTDHEHLIVRSPSEAQSAMKIIEKAFEESFF